MIEVPYKALFSKLKADIQQLAARAPKSGETLRLPVARITGQLSSGSVRVTFGELRQFSPPGIFNQNGHTEDDLIDLPLSELLPRLKAEHLGRRSKKKIEIPTDFDPVFGVGGANLRIAGSEKGNGSGGGKPKSSAQTIADFKAKLAAQAQNTAPAAPVGTDSAAAAAPAIPAPAVPPVSAKIPLSPISPLAPSVAGNAAEGPIKAPSLDPALANLKKAKILTLALEEIASHWNAAGKENLSTTLAVHTAELPMEVVELGLKRGKLAFPWSQFKGWVRAAAGGAVPDLPAEELIDLPLALVAPKFLGQHKPLRKQKKLTLSEEIPDVFGPKETASKQTAPAAPAPAPAVAAAPAVAPTPVAPPAPQAVAAVAPPAEPLSSNGAAPTNDFAAILGQPGKENWTLQEIVQQSAKIPGVAGVLIGTVDGLLVASSWPAGVKPETVAAFLPQMHGRVNQFSNHLQLGATDNFALVLNDLPLQVFRTSSSYFIVLGHPGGNLPKPQLSAVAQRLSQTTPR